MDKKWSEKTTLQKAMDIISAIALCVWLVFEALDRSNKFEYAGFAGCVAICVSCICEAISLWNVKRGLAYVAIAGVLFLVAVIVLQIMLLA